MNEEQVLHPLCAPSVRAAAPAPVADFPPVPSDVVARCVEFFAKRPGWLEGYIADSDALFLLRAIWTVRPELVVEIGTASGYSAAFLAFALGLAAERGVVNPDYRVVTYDLSPRYYGDPTKPTGAVAGEILSPGALRHIAFKFPTTALHAAFKHKGQGVRLVFIDAHHSHPWPALDLLMLLDCVTEGSIVALHDVNLPIVNPKFQDWGPKWLFDACSLERYAPADQHPPNIGALRISADLAGLRAELVRIIESHRWENDPRHIYKPSVLTRLGIRCPVAP